MNKGDANCHDCQKTEGEFSYDICCSHAWLPIIFRSSLCMAMPICHSVNFIRIYSSWTFFSFALLRAETILLRYSRHCSEALASLSAWLWAMPSDSLMMLQIISERVAVLHSSSSRAALSCSTNCLATILNCSLIGLSFGGMFLIRPHPVKALVSTHQGAHLFFQKWLALFPLAQF